MAVKYTKCPLKIPTSSTARPSKNYPNYDFWSENIPSGNPGFISHLCFCFLKSKLKIEMALIVLCKRMLARLVSVLFLFLFSFHPPARRWDDPPSVERFISAPPGSAALQQQPGQHGARVITAAREYREAVGSSPA
jgi:hypothetical protein